MTRRAFLVWLATWSAVIFFPAAADDGSPRIPLDIQLGKAYEATTRIAYEEALELRVDLSVVNDTDRPWSTLELSFETYDFAREAFVPVAAVAGPSFGRASLPVAAWREIFELRINDVYAGGPGGNWEVDFGRASQVMKIRFIEPPIYPQDRLSIRFPVSQTPPLWRLRAIATR